MGFTAAPLPHEYMIAGIIGFFVSVFFIANISRTWGFAIGILCLLLVIASIVSVSTDRVDEKALEIIGGEHYHRERYRTLADRRKKV